MGAVAPRAVFKFVNCLSRKEMVARISLVFEMLIGLDIL